MEGRFRNTLRFFEALKTGSKIQTCHPDTRALTRGDSRSLKIRSRPSQKSVCTGGRRAWSRLYTAPAYNIHFGWILGVGTLGLVSVCAAISNPAVSLAQTAREN